MDLKNANNKKAIALAFALVFLGVGVFGSAYGFMTYGSTNVIIPLHSADSVQLLYMNKLANGSNPNLFTLKSQFDTCEKLKYFYIHLAQSYYINFFSFSICSILFVALSSIATYLMVNKGFNQSSVMVKSFFLTSIMVGAIFYFLPNVLNNKENLKKNTERVKAYYQLQTDILAFASRIDQMDSTVIDSLLKNNFDLLSSNFDLGISIDNTTINSNPLDALKKSGSKKDN